MNVIKSVFGSLFGAAIGIGIYYAIKQSTGETYIWFPIVIGILTGIMARVIAGKSCSNTVRYVCGALAGLIAGCAIFGVDVVPSLMASQQTDFPPLINDRTETPATDDDEDDSEDSEETTTDEASDLSIDETNESADEDGEDVDESGEEDSENEGDSDAPEPGEEQSDESAEGGNADGEGANSSRKSAADAFRDRGAPSGPVNTQDPSAATERFAELIGKKSHDSWFDLYLPYIFCGIGILLAYQIARGFGGGEPKK